MADAPLVRRSGRTRTAVTSYADEQAQQDAASAPPAKRKKTAGKPSQLQPKDEMTGDVAIKSEYAQSDEQKPLLNKTKRVKSEPNDDEYTDAAPFKTEPTEDGEDLQPQPKPKKPRKKAVKKVKAIGKLDSEGVMRLDTTEPRPPGERKPPRVYEVPPRAKGKEINLAAILAENFEERFERKTSKIKRLGPGEPEVRLKRDIPFATDSYNTLFERATTQRLYVLSRSQSTELNCHAGHEDCPIHRFKVAGTTGNVYTVIISHIPTCSCPNTSFKRNDSDQALCKHMLYILHYVLKAPERLCQQNAFLTSELKEITDNAPALPTQTVEETPNDGNRKPVEDDCPICCMPFAPESEEITWCQAACGNNIHKECFKMWAHTKPKGVTCPFCRTLWHTETQALPGEQTETIVDVQMAQRVNGYYNVRDQLDYEE